MNSYKGIENIIKCISQFSREFREHNIKFKFIGNGPDLRIEGVDFVQVPLLSEKDLYEIFKTTDLLLVPSKSDNSPNIIFEAALFGTPFLGSNRTGLPELAKMFDLPTFEFGNTVSLFEGIMEIKSQVISRQKIRNIALEHTNPKSIALKMRNLYQEKLTDVKETRADKES
jgi:glycosyltransferase involved in cell wall biosynthesis